MGPALLVSVLAALGPGAPAAQPTYKPFYEVVFENGVDLSQAPRVLRAVRKLESDYPALVTPQVLSKIVFASPERQLGNVHYCFDATGSGFDKDQPCALAGHKAILVDLDLILSFESRYGDFYQKGREIEAVIFHELLHGWAYHNSERLREYVDAASDGRLTLFERPKHRLYRHLWKLERRIRDARFRIEMGDDTREQYAARGASELEQKTRQYYWDDIHPRMTLEGAREVLVRNERRLEAYRPRFGRRVERFTSRYDIPRRHDRDPHAIDDEQEWFAYGGEIAFYAAEPAELLEPEELAWWKALGAELRGEARSSAAVSQDGR